MMDQLSHRYWNVGYWLNGSFNHALPFYDAATVSTADNFTFAFTNALAIGGQTEFPILWTWLVLVPVKI